MTPEQQARGLVMLDKGGFMACMVCMPAKEFKPYLKIVRQVAEMEEPWQHWYSATFGEDGEVDNFEHSVCRYCGADVRDKRPEDTDHGPDCCYLAARKLLGLE